MGGRFLFGTIAILLAVTSGALGTVAFAYEQVHGGTEAQIQQTVVRYHDHRRDTCIKTDRFRFRGAWVSTADRRYGQGLVLDNSCTHALGYFVRRPSRSGGRWRVIGAYPQSAQDCQAYTRFLPKAVIRDFGVEGVSRSGDFGRCVKRR